MQRVLYKLNLFFLLQGTYCCMVSRPAATLAVISEGLPYTLDKRGHCHMHAAVLLKPLVLA